MRRAGKGEAAPPKQVDDPEETKARKGAVQAPNIESECGLSGYYGLLGGLVLTALRVLGGIINIIPDCDETFNYWEPVHYLLYGFGQQTWEYSPRITLRSYAYLLPHVLVGKVLDLGLLRLLHLPCGKVLVFYGIRIVLGLFSALAEVLFVQAVATRMSASVGVYTFLFLTFSSGLFQSSTAMLPSSAASTFILLTHSAWLSGSYPLATLLSVAAVLLLGWPFIALLFVPLAVHVLHQSIADKGLIKGTRDVVIWGVASLALCLPLALAIDTHYYRRPVLPALNIALYNLGKGPEGASDELYGVAPASYYIKNLLVNLNVVVPLAAALPITAIARAALDIKGPGRAAAPSLSDQLIFLSPALLWLAVMFSRPHKEERFLFPIYPLLALAAALSLDGLLSAVNNGAIKVCRAMHEALRVSPLCRLAALFVLVLHALLSASRVANIVTGYGAPLAIYRDLSTSRLSHLSGTEAKVCVAGDWYRFPSSFFLPSASANLSYVKSSFTGQLPQHFRPENGTWDDPLLPFNELNQEEPSRYVPLSSCTYLIEYFPPPLGASQAAVDKQIKRLGGSREVGRWAVADRRPFLDSESSPSPYRAFFVPVVGQKRLSFGDYALLMRKG